MTAEKPAKPETLESWKEIAAYLNRDVRTVRRWEKDRGLPVRRLPGTRPGVYARIAEIDAWRNIGASNGGGMHAAAEPAPALEQAKARRVVWWVAAAASLTGIAVLIVFWAPPGAPQLRTHVEITHNGWAKRALLRRGAALFYQSIDPGSGMSGAIRRIGASGDELMRRLPPGAHRDLLDVSPDGSTVLFKKRVAGKCDSELWLMPLASGQPYKMGNMCTTAAEWCRDGSKLAYNDGRELYLANPDGTAAKRLLTLPCDNARYLHWSADGRRIRLVLADSRQEHQRLWDVQIDGPTAAPLLPGWSRDGADLEEGGQWTLDGRWFIFTAVHQGAEGIWGIHQSPFLFDRWLTRPIFLASAPKADYVTPGPGGDKLFALVSLPRRGELVRLDPITDKFELAPEWRWLSGGQLAFSPDGSRVAYMSFPEQLLWTADLDGKNPLLLTPGIQRGALPQWSPDGRSLAFMSWRSGVHGFTRIRIVSRDGQNPIEPVPLSDGQGAPSWISNTELVFGENGPSSPIPATCSLHVFDLETGKAAVFPGTTGLWTARACPTGRYIAAQTNDKTRLVLYDRRTATRTELFRSPEGQLGDDPVWSPDGAYIYMDVPYARDPAIYRIGIRDHKIDRIAELTGIQRVVEDIGVWMGLAPDHSLLILRDVEGSEINSWDWVE